MVVFESVPPPLVTVQLTPAAFLSLLTVAVKVTVSAPSTVIDEAVIAMLIGFEPPPQPDKHTAKLTAKAEKKVPLRTLTPEHECPKIVRRSYALPGESGTGPKCNSTVKRN